MMPPTSLNSFKLLIFHPRIYRQTKVTNAPTRSASSGDQLQSVCGQRVIAHYSVVL